MNTLKSLTRLCGLAFIFFALAFAASASASSKTPGKNKMTYQFPLLSSRKFRALTTTQKATYLASVRAAIVKFELATGVKKHYAQSLFFDTAFAEGGWKTGLCSAGGRVFSTVGGYCPVSQGKTCAPPAGASLGSNDGANTGRAPASVGLETMVVRAPAATRGTTAQTKKKADATDDDNTGDEDDGYDDNLNEPPADTGAPTTVTPQRHTPQQTPPPPPIQPGRTGTVRVNPAGDTTVVGPAAKPVKKGVDPNSPPVDNAPQPTPVDNPPPPPAPKPDASGVRYFQCGWPFFNRCVPLNKDTVTEDCSKKAEAPPATQAELDAAHKEAEGKLKSQMEALCADATNLANSVITNACKTLSDALAKTAGDPKSPATNTPLVPGTNSGGGTTSTSAKFLAPGGDPDHPETASTAPDGDKRNNGDTPVLSAEVNKPECTGQLHQVEAKLNKLIKRLVDMDSSTNADDRSYKLVINECGSVVQSAIEYLESNCKVPSRTTRRLLDNLADRPESDQPVLDRESAQTCVKLPPKTCDSRAADYGKEIALGSKTRLAEIKQNFAQLEKRDGPTPFYLCSSTPREAETFMNLVKTAQGQGLKEASTNTPSDQNGTTRNGDRGVQSVPQE